ncbi:MAG: DUF4115 domain-containing protein [Neisseria sp.]|nr:DUF4115 domain-containing protein [Neisseria sp.]
MSETPSKVTVEEWQQQIGVGLSAAREIKKLSLAQVAEYLKLRVNQIKAIENGNWSNLPAAVFARGFIRKYAALLEIENDILPMLDKALPPTSVQMQKNLVPSQSKEEVRRKPIPTWLKVLVPVVLAVLGVVWWQSHSLERSKQQDEALLVQDTLPSTPEINHGNVLVVPLPEAQASETVASETAVSGTALSSTAVSEAAPVVTDNVLTINARYRTYLSVSDADGATLINQLVPGGSQQQLTGKPPYQIRIGYALGSTVEFNGTSYEMAPYLNGRTANLTVPAP